MQTPLYTHVHTNTLSHSTLHTTILPLTGLRHGVRDHQHCRRDSHLARPLNGQTQQPRETPAASSGAPGSERQAHSTRHNRCTVRCPRALQSSACFARITLALPQIQPPDPTLTCSTPSALQAKALELERQRATDNLKKGLATRSDRDDLVQRNILPNSTAAPALQGHQKELEHHMRADSLEKGLQSRPSPEELVKKGILQGDENPLKDA